MPVLIAIVDYANPLRDQERPSPMTAPGAVCAPPRSRARSPVRPARTKVGWVTAAAYI